MTDELKLPYACNTAGCNTAGEFVDAIAQFAKDHPAKDWRHFVRLNQGSIVLAAVSVSG